MKPWFAVALLLAAASAFAQTTYRWTDADGKLHFSDKPPPAGAAKKVEALKPGASAADEQQLPYETRMAAQNFPVTHFVSPDCREPCQQGREFLKRRGIPFNEMNIGDPAGLAAFQAAAGKDAQGVPVLRVGTQVAKGFLAASWNSLLDAAGYAKAAK